MSTPLQSILQQGFATLKFERRILENEICIFETFPLDNTLWISFRLKETAMSFKDDLQKEYLKAILLSMLTKDIPMRTSFFEGKAHSFLTMNKFPQYRVMNRPPVVLAIA
jgi:hypothetical protein